MNHILFRVDAGPNVGLGHLQRCMSLAKALETLDVDSVFLTNNHSETIGRIQRFGFEAFELRVDDAWGDEDSTTTIELAAQHDCSAIVIDSYMAGHKYMSHICRDSFVTCVIDDLASYTYPCQIVVNGNLNANELTYVSTCGDTRFLLGREYLMLRQEFWDKSDFVVRPTVHNILVVLGGSDIHNLMPSILKMLDDMPYDFIINAIIGPFVNNEYNIDQVVDKARHAINLFRAPDEVKDLMIQADLAISAGGQTLYELLRVGCPTVAVEVALNHSKQLEALVELGCLHTVCNVADNSVVSNIAKSVHLLLSNYQLRSSMSNMGQQLFDGQGALRVANLLYDVIKAE